MEGTDYVAGEFIWQDQSSEDVSQAAVFYSTLFGWEVAPGDEQFGGYRECRLDGKKVAALSPQMQPGPAYWGVYVKAEDAAEIAEKAKTNGGQVVVEPMEIGDFGSMAVISDPTGAALGVWQSGSHHGFEVRNQPGAACWHELITDDVDAASSFYRAVLGWEARTHGPEVAGGYREFVIGDRMVGGLMAKPPMMPAGAPSFWGVYFAVADVDATVAKAVDLSGRVIVEPRDIAPGRFATVADSTGAVFNLLASSR